MVKVIERAIVDTLLKRLQSSPPLLQIVVGPRQVGKTTAVKQVLRRWKGPSHYATADLPSPPDSYWIQAQWQIARQEAQSSRQRTLLVLDEVQKIPRWGDVVKALADEDRDSYPLIRTVLLGSASLHIHRGAQESLAGRFELHFCSHWSWPECREAFGWDLNQWLYYGGYPGGGRLIAPIERWKQYISESLVESVLSRDVLQLTTILKPALLRQLFMLAVHTPAQILSFNKMLGQLQDAGNTVTLAHYLRLLESAYLVSGLPLWSGGLARHRASSPKFVIWNNGLIGGLSTLGYKEALRRPDLWGHWVENAVGAHILNSHDRSARLFYWRDGNAEVDYVIEKGRDLCAIEVKSGFPSPMKNLNLFCKRYPRVKPLRVGSGGIPLEKFFTTPPANWF